jgi:HAD superfamily hydrolase (TIGR01509 family)
MKLALLFDLGGVLLDAFPERAVAGFARLSGRRASDLIAPVLWNAKLAFDSGRINPTEFTRQVGEACHMALTEAQVHECWCDIFEDLPEMQRFVERLAPGYDCYLLSNTDPWHYEAAVKRLPLLGLFRGDFLSFEAGRLKPDSEYYRSVFERFHLDPADCVLIDDRPDNVAAIVALGAQGIVHRDAATTEAALAALGVRP